MSTFQVGQSIPIIIKGGSKSGILAKPIEIHADSAFEVTEQFQSQENEWIQSDSGFSISYVESIVIGDSITSSPFCQTSTMAHPLTFEFKDSDYNNIFTVKEIAGSGTNYLLQISVDLPDDYFQITESPKSDDPNWTVSAFDTMNTEVATVVVVDANGVPVCRLPRLSEVDIALNLEPPV